MNRSTRSYPGPRTVSLWLSLAPQLLGCAPAAAPDELLVQFDGERCSFQALESILEGEWPITLNNETDSNMALDVGVLAAGKTWQEVLDLIGEPGSSEATRPDWLDQSDRSSIPNTTDTRLYSLEPGLNAVVWVQHNPHAAWPGSTVEALPR